MGHDKSPENEILNEEAVSQTSIVLELIKIRRSADIKLTRYRPVKAG
jgi:hypothetical protein